MPSLSITRVPISIALRTVSAGGAALGGLLAHDPGGARVVDGQPLDHEPVVERADGAVAGGLIEGELWSFGRFHENLRR